MWVPPVESYHSKPSYCNILLHLGLLPFCSHCTYPSLKSRLIHSLIKEGLWLLSNSECQPQPGRPWPLPHTGIGMYKVTCCFFPHLLVLQTLQQGSRLRISGPECLHWRAVCCQVSDSQTLWLFGGCWSTAAVVLLDLVTLPWKGEGRGEHRLHRGTLIQPGMWLMQGWL